MNSRKFASQSLADETIAGVNSSIGSTKHNQTLNITFQNQKEETETEGKREDANMSYINALAQQ